MLIPFALATLALAVPVHATEVVTDGGFEIHDPWVWVTPYNDMFGTWNVPGTTDASLQLGRFGGIVGDDAWQAVDLSRYTSATLSFDLTTVAHGTPNAALFDVSLGYDNTVYREWLGAAPEDAAVTRHLSFVVTNPNAFVVGSPLNFSGSNRWGSDYRMWVDNVSIQAVPEPATLVVLGLGATNLLRRRGVGR